LTNSIRLHFREDPGDFTTQLDNWGRFLIAFTMFWGRLGPLTIVVALAQSEQPLLIHYPEEPVILG